MAFKVVPKKVMPARIPSKPLERGEILQKIFSAACWWILAQGIAMVLLNFRLASWFHMRYGYEIFATVKMYGVCLITLGYYLRKASKEPAREMLLVDTLVLFFLGNMIVTFLTLTYSQVSKFEWFSQGVSAVLVALLLRYRTSANMAAALNLPPEAQAKAPAEPPGTVASQG